MVTVVNTIVLCTCKLSLNVLTTRMKLCDMMEVLANAVVVIIMQYRSVSDQPIAYLKFAQRYMSIISQLCWEK